MRASRWSAAAVSNCCTEIKPVLFGEGCKRVFTQEPVIEGTALTKPQGLKQGSVTTADTQRFGDHKPGVCTGFNEHPQQMRDIGKNMVGGAPNREAFFWENGADACTPYAAEAARVAVSLPG